MAVRQDVIAALVVLVVALALVISRPFASPDPIRIGLIGSFSGRFASLGVTGRDGALLAAEEVNAAGGVLGRPVELVLCDDRGDGQACRAAISELAAAGCRLVVGPFATGPATAALEDINRLEVLTIAPTVAGDNLSGQDDWFLRLYPSTRTMGRMLGALHRADGDGELVVVGDQANGPFLSTTVAGVAEAGARVRQVAFDSRQDPSLVEVAAAVGVAPAVLLVASSLDTAVLAQRLRQRLPEVRLLCASWAVSPELIANGGGAIDGMRTVLPIGLGIDPGLEHRFGERFGGELTHVALLYHEALHLVVDAITATGSTEPLQLRRALTDGRTLPGQRQPVLDGNGDPVRPLVPHRILAGRLVAEVPQ